MIRFSAVFLAAALFCPSAWAQTPGEPAALSPVAAAASASPPAAAAPTPPEEGPLAQTLGAPQGIKDGFIRYIPDSAGDIDWEIRGSGAEFKTEDIVTLVELFARSHDEELGPVSIEIPRGDYDLQARSASAPGQWVVVRRGPLLLTGKGVLWSISREEIRILEDVRVLVKESGNLGLFPGE